MMPQPHTGQPTFGKIRQFLWPIHGYETKKFLPMCLMMFFMIFNYTVLRNTKDSLVMPMAGAEVIPFLKGGIVMPFSLLFVAVYAKMANVLKREMLFYSTIGIFLVFFIFFILVLYPNRDFVQPSAAMIRDLQQNYKSLQHIFPLFGSWIYMAFYVFAELWGAVIINLLFWQFANEITRIQEAKRFYTMFGFIGHAALIAGGFAVKKSCELTEGPDACSQYLTYSLGQVIISGIIIIAIYRWLNVSVLTNKRYYDPKISEDKVSEKKTSLSLTNSFKLIFSSKYLGLIAFLVFSFSFSMYILGLLWKKQLQLQYPDPIAYADFMGNYSMLTGVLTVTIIFFFKGVVSHFGWFRGAVATPLILFFTSIVLFGSMFFTDLFSPFLMIFGTSPLMLAVLISTLQQIIGKSSKYALFDPTKEMAYIPLNDELKVKGKAAVDVSIHQFGKAAGGYLTGGLLVGLMADHLIEVAPYFAGFVFITIILWIGAVWILNKEYHHAIHLHNEKHGNF
jgi:ATP:ADP antiporter, AAA family